MAVPSLQFQEMPSPGYGYVWTQPPNFVLPTVGILGYQGGQASGAGDPNFSGLGGAAERLATPRENVVPYKRPGILTPIMSTLGIRDDPMGFNRIFLLGGLAAAGGAYYFWSRWGRW